MLSEGLGIGGTLLRLRARQRRHFSLTVDYLSIMREVHENPLLNKAHFHILFDYLPLPFTPYTSLAESLSNIEFSALLWGKLTVLGVGLITDSDYPF